MSIQDGFVVCLVVLSACLAIFFMIAGIDDDRD